jgi:hypothetical protein
MKPRGDAKLLAKILAEPDAQQPCSRWAGGIDLLPTVVGTAVGGRHDVVAFGNVIRSVLYAPDKLAYDTLRVINRNLNRKMWPRRRFGPWRQVRILEQQSAAKLACSGTGTTSDL